MKKLLAAVVLLAGACAGPKIPDDLPPAPPARTGDPITAPSNARVEAEEDGFGGDGFGGEEVAIEVEATAEEAESSVEKKEDEKGPKEDAKDKKDGDKEEPSTQPTIEESAK